MYGNCCVIADLLQLSDPALINPITTRCVLCKCVILMGFLCPIRFLNSLTFNPVLYPQTHDQPDIKKRKGAPKDDRKTAKKKKSSADPVALNVPGKYVEILHLKVHSLSVIHLTCFNSTSLPDLFSFSFTSNKLFSSPCIYMSLRSQ